MSSGVSRSGASKSRQLNSVGDLNSVALDASATTVDIQLGIIASSLTWVMNGTLVGTIEFSINGKDFYDSTNLKATGVPDNYTMHLVKVVRLTRSSGSGVVTIACV